MAFLIKKAQRAQAKIRLAIAGPSGSGKTYSSLLIASGLGSKICVIDTERASAHLYAGLVDYDVLELEPPYRPKRYVEAIRSAEEAGYDVIVVDSLSHAWSGEGGSLEQHDMASAKTKNSYTAWRDVTPEHNFLVDAILNSKCHVIATMRSKTAYELIEGKVKKLGLEPIQRAGMEYEFTLFFDVEKERHVASASKDRTSLFDGENFVPTRATGEKILAWLNSGSPAEKAPTLVAVQVAKDEPHKQEQPEEEQPKVTLLPEIGVPGAGVDIKAAESSVLMGFQQKLDSMRSTENGKRKESAEKWLVVVEREINERLKKEV